MQAASFSPTAVRMAGSMRARTDYMRAFRDICIFVVA